MEVSLEHIEHIAQLILNSPQGRELRAQQSAKSTRQFFFTRRESLRAQQARELPPLEKEMEQARLELEAAAAVLKQKRETYEQAVAVHTEKYVYFDMQLSSVENTLRSSAPAIIGEYIRDWSNRIDAVSNAGLQSIAVRTADYDIESGKYRTVMVNNADAVNATVTALRAAVQGAHNLTLSNLTEEEVRARLDELDRAIPPVHGVFEPSPPPSVHEAVTAIRESHDLARATGSAIDRAKRRVRAFGGY
jgi:hypothetical protein